ncbi:glycosyltransferase family 2 protein [Arthrobacter ginkgonis]|uniref:4,4'-diaponeurosporenoate glycosyltransferase n=1 Tax=Arthrobacter ginkgonis TaxID=1630594 RepID=A0ABP7D0C2_9MICC
MSLGNRRIRHAAVVVPVRNEEDLLPVCLAHLRRAMDHFEARRGGRTARCAVVLDRCTDASARIAASAAADDPRILVLEVGFGSVGQTRAAGVGALMAGTGRRGLEATWIGCTDADTLVPPQWLAVGADLADAGADAVLGTVEPDPLDTDPELLGLWRGDHDSGDGHPHVHGANLGVRASAYLEAGGFPAVSLDEDVLLVEALRKARKTVVASGAVPAVTSGRLDGRTAGGFAGYLRALRAAAGDLSETAAAGRS